MRIGQCLLLAAIFLLAAPPLGECHLPRPRVFPEIHDDPVPDVEKLPALDGLLKTMTMFDVARTVARASAPALKFALEELANQATEKDVIILGVMTKALNALWAKNEEDCNTCKTAMDAVKDLIDLGQPFSTLGDPLITVCETVMALNRNWDPVMCNGTINIQGPHVYYILGEATAEKFCETLNACMPPKASSRKPDVRSRLPWKQTRQLRDVIKESHETEKAEDVIHIAQLTDIHIQPKYAIGSPSECLAYVCCLEESLSDVPEKPARTYGEYECNIPERTMHLFLNKVAELSPDFIIYSGDTPPHTMWDETRTSQLNCSNILLSALNQTLGSYKIYPNIGNHEMFPTNLYHPEMTDTVVMNEAFATGWQGLAGFNEEQMTTMRALGYYTMAVPGHTGLRILSINTVHDWYSANFYATLNDDSTETLEFKQFVSDTLDAAETAGEKVIVIGHHPTGSDCMVRASRWWEEIARQYRDVIVLHVAGHTHDDSLRLFMDEAGEATSAIHVTPSVTSNTNVNPSMRLFTLDSATYTPLDMETYYFDISTATDVEPDIILHYRASEEYGMPNLTAASWRDLVLRFVYEDDLFQKWYNNYNTGNVATNEECDKACKENHLCRMWFASMDEIEECIAFIDIDKLTTTTPATTTTDKDVTNSGHVTLAGSAFTAVLLVLAFVSV